MKTFIRALKRTAVKICGIIGIACAFTVGAKAQDQQYLLSLSGVVPIGASNVVTFAAVNGTTANFQLNTKLTGAGTSGIAVVLEQSNDNSTWSTTPIQFWRAANGATAVSHMTNFTLTAPFYRATIHNTNSLAVTNSTISVVVKKDYR